MSEPTFENGYANASKRYRVKAFKAELYDEAAAAIDCYEDGTGRDLSDDPDYMRATDEVVAELQRRAQRLS